MNTQQLHDEFERRAPKGIGAAIDLGVFQSIAAIAIQGLARPIKGVTEQIPIPLTSAFQAAFTPNPATFKLDATAHSVSLDLSVWIHVAGNSAQRIATLSYSLRQMPVTPAIDQTTLNVSLTPAGTTNIQPTSTAIDPLADGALIAAKYVTAGGAADWTRFNQEVYYPFVWNVAQGIARSAISSLPVPQPFSSLESIASVPPIQAAMVNDYLLVWSAQANAILPQCGEKPSPLPPGNASWGAQGIPASPFDNNRAPIALYIAAQPLLDWHSGVLKPAVFISQSGGTVVGWRFDAAIGLDSLVVTLNGAANGGSVTATAALKVVGVASAWLNLPCGMTAGLASGSIQGDATASGTFTAVYDKTARMIDAEFSAQGALSAGNLNVDFGGLFGDIISDIVNWLIHLGIIKIGAQFSERGDVALWDAGKLNATGTYPATTVPRMRVGKASILIGVFADNPMAAAGSDPIAR